MRGTSEGEWKLMELLWARSPRTSLELALSLRGELTRLTVCVLLNRLADRGAVTVDSSERAKRYSPRLSREEASPPPRRTAGRD